MFLFFFKTKIGWVIFVLVILELSFVLGIGVVVGGVKLKVMVFFLRVVVNDDIDLIDKDFLLYFVVSEEDFFKEIIFFGEVGLSIL